MRNTTTQKPQNQKKMKKMEKEDEYTTVEISRIQKCKHIVYIFRFLGKTIIHISLM